MGILNDFINTIRSQRTGFKDEQRRAEMERIARENEAKAREAREREAAMKRKEEMEWAAREKEAKLKATREREYLGKSEAEDKGFLGGVTERIKGQRREFEEAQRKGAEAGKGGTQTVQEAKVPPGISTITRFGHTFMRKPGLHEHVFIDDAAKAIYIDDVNAFIKEGGKVEKRDITAAMDPYMYDIYTSKGGPVGQARYYKAEDRVISLVEDPFARYR